MNFKTREFKRKVFKLFPENELKYDYSKTNYIGSKEKIIIICLKHGEFEQKAANHINGNGCPKCGNLKQIKNSVKSNKKFISEANVKHNNIYNYSNTNYINSYTKIIINCKIHGDFYQLPNAHLQGSGCPKCGILKQTKTNTKTNTKYINEVKLKHNERYDYSKTNYLNSEEKIIIICSEHGEFEQKAASHLNGHGCPKCGFVIKTNDQFVFEANLKHNNKYKYPEKYVHSQDKIKIICPEHGEFNVLSYQHLQGIGCQKCSINKRSLINLKSKDQWILELNLKHNNKYKYPDEIFNSKDKIKIICSEHGEFFQRIDMHLFGNGCPNCSYELNISNSELEIFNYIKEMGIDNIQTSNRTILNGQELDIYLPDYNLAIEFNGLYWHSDKFKNDNYHNLKTEECLNKNIRLIHIFEDEWLFKKEIVKSRLRNLLKKNDLKIFARKTKIKEINSETSRKFLENNHLQGFVGAKVHLGLFYTSENGKEYLVSVMNFGSLRKNLGNQSNEGSYELLRFASLKNFNIIGGANKLLKYFEKTYNPQYILSYADRRWSNGNLYNQLNFELSHISKPNYFYIQGNKKLNRFGYRKDILISKYGCKPEQTEKEFCRENLNMTRIYDCGNYVFHKKYS